MNREYYSILKEKLKKYPYEVDYVHSVDGVNINIPMIYGDASTVVHFFLVDIKKAKNFIKDERIKPIAVAPGKTLLAINTFEYRELKSGSFEEFTFSIPVRFGKVLNIPLIPLIFDQVFKNSGFYVIQLGASNDIGRRHIEDIWGYPTYKNNLDISLSIQNNRITSTIADGDDLILEISEDLPNKQSKFQKRKIETYFKKGDDLRNVKLETLLFSTLWLGKRNLDVKLGNHELSNMLRELGVEKKVATVFYPNAVEIAAKPHVI